MQSGADSPTLRTDVTPPGTVTAPAADRLAAWPSHILRGCQPSYHWTGAAPLSVKLFLHGAAHYRAGDGGRYRVDESAYLVLNHGQTYEITIDSPTPVESFCLFFDAKMVSETYLAVTEQERTLLDDPCRATDPPRFFERTYAHDDVLSPRLFALRAAMQRIPSSVHPEPTWVAERLHHALEGLLAAQRVARMEARDWLCVGARPATREELYLRLHRARDYIEAAYSDPVTLDEMAAIACLSTNHFLRTFKAAFRRTPHQFLTDCRIRAARQLLAETDLTVTDVCLRVGFVGLGSFSHLFARRVGASPEGYRRGIRADMRKGQAMHSMQAMGLTYRAVTQPVSVSLEGVSASAGRFRERRRGLDGSYVPE
jgi:AraC-like DNA-binding protein